MRSTNEAGSQSKESCRHSDLLQTKGLWGQALRHGPEAAERRLALDRHRGAKFKGSMEACGSKAVRAEETGLSQRGRKTRTMGWWFSWTSFRIFTQDVLGLGAERKNYTQRNGLLTMRKTE